MKFMMLSETSYQKSFAELQLIQIPNVEVKPIWLFQCQDVRACRREIDTYYIDSMTARLLFFALKVNIDTSQGHHCKLAFSSYRCNSSMGKAYKVPPIPFSQAPPTIAPDQAVAHQIEPLDPLKSRGTSELDSPLHPPSQSENTRDGPALDIQCVNLILVLQSLLERSREWPAPNTASKKSDAISSLQTTLVDLRVWAYDLSNSDASLLGYLRNLSSHSYALKTRLRQMFDDIGHVLALIEDETGVYEEAGPRFVTLCT